LITALRTSTFLASLLVIASQEVETCLRHKIHFTFGMSYDL
jgi:hypothetical protein